MRFDKAFLMKEFESIIDNNFNSWSVLDVLEVIYEQTGKDKKSLVNKLDTVESLSKRGNICTICDN
jgi:uncharacterized phage-associated protein